VSSLPVSSSSSSCTPPGDVGDGIIVGTGISVGEVGCPRDLLIDLPMRPCRTCVGGPGISVGDAGAGCNGGTAGPSPADAAMDEPVGTVSCGTGTSSSTPPVGTAVGTGTVVGTTVGSPSDRGGVAVGGTGSSVGVGSGGGKVVATVAGGPSV
jgi:hypothetical protein